MKLQVSAIGFQSCQGCQTLATLRTLDIAVAAIPARKPHQFNPEVPAGWCPLIALCGTCWTEVMSMLREKAIPDSSGVISP